jgi:hypothetical protein
MTDLEARLRTLHRPTTPAPPAPSLRMVELEAAARRHRHRSARILAVAAAVVVVATLAAVVVRRPQPSTLDTAAVPPGTDQASDTIVVSPESPLPSNVLLLHVVGEADGAKMDETAAILRQRLDSSGAGTARLTTTPGGYEITFDPAVDAANVSGLLTAALPVRLYGEVTRVAPPDTPP